MRPGKYEEATVPGPLGLIDVSDVAREHEPAAAVDVLNDHLIRTGAGCVALFFSEGHACSIRGQRRGNGISSESQLNPVRLRQRSGLASQIQGDCDCSYCGDCDTNRY